MAGERKGKTYEAIVLLALRTIKDRLGLQGDIFWNQTPSRMTIEPDFTIGKDPDGPDFVILVTHSGSAKDSEKKFWRNLGELAESKIFLAVSPRVYSIAFDAVIKEDLKTIQSHAFDDQLIVGDLDYCSELRDWVDSLGKLPSEQEKKLASISSAISNSSNLVRVFTRFTADIGNMLVKSNSESDSLWHLGRKEQGERRVPVARNTFFRR